MKIQKGDIAMLPEIKNEEVLKALGINLEFELKNDDEPSSKVSRFIADISDWCYDFLRTHYGLNDDISDLATWRQDYFKAGVIKQIEYVLRNGKLNIDSGFVRETGLVVNLSALRIAPDARNKFFLGGFCNIARC